MSISIYRIDLENLSNFVYINTDIVVIDDLDLQKYIDNNLVIHYNNKFIYVNDISIKEFISLLVKLQLSKLYETNIVSRSGFVDLFSKILENCNDVVDCFIVICLKFQLFELKNDLIIINNNIILECHQLLIDNGFIDSSNNCK